MTEPRFDELIHPSTRLSIVALLASADWIEFGFVRDQLGLSDSALSKQLATLEEAGYLAIERYTSERRRRMRALYDKVTTHNIGWWTTTFLDMLATPLADRVATPAAR